MNSPTPEEAYLILPQLLWMEEITCFCTCFNWIAVIALYYEEMPFTLGCSNQTSDEICLLYQEVILLMHTIWSTTVIPTIFSFITLEEVGILADYGDTFYLVLY